MVNRCKATNASSEPCAAYVHPGQDFCRWHDPERHEERKQWRRTGGKNKANHARLRRVWGEDQLTPSELAGLLSAAMIAVYEGKFDASVLTALSSGARALLEVHKTTEFEERLALLERRAGIGGVA